MTQQDSRIHATARALLCAGLVATWFAACGGSETNPSTSTSTTSSAASGGGDGGSGGATTGTGGSGGTGGMAPACGDGTQQSNEECDDGNLFPGDGCSATCTVEPVPEACPGLDIPLTEEGVTIVGSTIGKVSDAQGERCGGYNSPDVMYAVTPNVTGTLSATLYGSYDKVFIARDDCTSGEADAELGCVRGYGAKNITLWVIAGETYHFIVDGNMGASGDFTLTLDLYRCGDGVVQGLEQCDDGNTNPGDGCNGCVNCLGPGEFWDPVGQHCYRLVSQPDFWSGAQRVCREWGGDLVGISSASELSLVAQNVGMANVWTGGVDRHDLGEDCSFLWSNGEPWRSVFLPPDPDHFNADSCIEFLSATQSFADSFCGLNRQPLCERSPHGSCGDGILQANEECDDGNTTQGDGCETCSVVCPPGELKEPISRHCYRIVTVSPKTWDEAAMDCVAVGGQLASLDTPREVAFLTPQVMGSMWIGGRRNMGNFTWTNAEPWCHQNWAVGEPQGGTDCVAVGTDGTWATGACDTVQGYICERPPWP